MYLKKDEKPAQRVLENEALLLRNNHKSARDNPHVIVESLRQEVIRGYAFIIPRNAIPLLPSAMICPLGIIEQCSLAADGSRKLKKRLTHDQTFIALSDSQSVNKLTNVEKFPPLIYGFCLNRIILQIISIRFHYPYQRILISKFDYAKAYRRMHNTGSTALQCIAVFEAYAYVQLRLSFGGTGCPYAYGVLLVR